MQRRRTEKNGSGIAMKCSAMARSCCECLERRRRSIAEKRGGIAKTWQDQQRQGAETTRHVRQGQSSGRACHRYASKNYKKRKED